MKPVNAQIVTDEQCIQQAEALLRDIKDHSLLKEPNQVNTLLGLALIGVHRYAQNIGRQLADALMIDNLPPEHHREMVAHHMMMLLQMLNEELKQGLEEGREQRSDEMKDHIMSRIRGSASCN